MSKVLSDLAQKTTMLAWYKDPAKFFYDIYGLKPYPYQEKVIRQLADPSYHRVLICASAGSGKTKLVACHALWLALVYSYNNKRPVSVVIISGSDSQSKNLYNYIKEALIGNPIISKMVEGEPLASGVTFKDGSEIKAVPNSHKQIQGLHKDVVIIDEPSLAGDFAIQDAKRIVIKDNSLNRILLLGTPFIPPESKVKSTLFVDMWEDRETYKDWVRYHWSAMDCPTVTAEQMEEARKTLPEDMYNIFWLGKPYFLGDSLIPFEQLKRASMNVKTEWTPGIRTVAGLDWGYKAETVLTLMQVKEGIIHIVLSEGWKREEYADLHDRIANICKQYNVDVIYADSEAIGENQRLEARGLRVIPIIFRNDKVRMQTRMKFLFHQNRIRIDEEMIKLKNQLRKYNWDTHDNDDRVDSMMLAINEEDTEPDTYFFAVIKA